MSHSGDVEGPVLPSVPPPPVHKVRAEDIVTEVGKKAGKDESSHQPPCVLNVDSRLSFISCSFVSENLIAIPFVRRAGFDSVFKQVVTQSPSHFIFLVPFAVSRRESG